MLPYWINLPSVCTALVKHLGKAIGGEGLQHDHCRRTGGEGVSRKRLCSLVALAPRGKV